MKVKLWQHLIKVIYTRNNVFQNNVNKGTHYIGTAIRY